MLSMTSPTFQDRLDSYAELLVRVGVNLQPGQKLIVRANVDDAPLVRKVVDIAYSLGSPFVEVFWSDGPVTRSRFLKGPEGSFDIIPEYRAEGMIKLAEEGAASLAITSEDPDLLAGVDPQNVAAFQAAWRKAVRPYMNLSMSDSIAWCVAGAASAGWATKAFPDLKEQEAVEALWQAIFTATRITTEDPVGEWRRHNEQLRQKRELLYYGVDEPLLFVGHYWQQGRPQPLRPNLACLDYSAVKYGRLVAYRWSGEDRVLPDNFVWVKVI